MLLNVAAVIVVIGVILQAVLLYQVRRRCTKGVALRVEFIKEVAPVDSSLPQEEICKGCSCDIMAVCDGCSRNKEPRKDKYHVR